MVNRKGCASNFSPNFFSWDWDSSAICVYALANWLSRSCFLPGSISTAASMAVPSACILLLVPVLPSAPFCFEVFLRNTPVSSCYSFHTSDFPESQYCLSGCPSSTILLSILLSCVTFTASCFNPFVTYSPLLLWVASNWQCSPALIFQLHFYTLLTWQPITLLSSSNWVMAYLQTTCTRTFPLLVHVGYNPTSQATITGRNLRDRLHICSQDFRV